MLLIVRDCWLDWYFELSFWFGFRRQVAASYLPNPTVESVFVLKKLLVLVLDQAAASQHGTCHEGNGLRVDQGLHQKMQLFSERRVET